LSKTRRLLLSLSKILLLVAIVYSFFLPLKSGTILFYLGLILTLVGLAGAYLIILNWVKAPLEELIKIGFYRYSRHPMYIFDSVFLLGISLVTASWLFFIFTLVYMIGCIISANIEEKGCIKQYGKSYREYMKKTPKWIGLPKTSS
jgi:protein-S-isoprenylcysteine O-methyltransferase Ste14